MRKSWVRMERRADGSIPLTAILAARRTARATTPAPSASPIVSLAAREVLFEDGAASIVDAAVSPTARVEIAGVRLTARDFSWPARAPIPVRLETPTPGAGTVTARGSPDLIRKSL